jgi:hypothetical protein
MKNKYILIILSISALSLLIFFIMNQSMSYNEYTKEANKYTNAESLFISNVTTVYDNLNAGTIDVSNGLNLVLEKKDIANENLKKLNSMHPPKNMTTAHNLLIESYQDFIHSCDQSFYYGLHNMTPDYENLTLSSNKLEQAKKYF